MESYYAITLNSGHINSTRLGILLDLIQMINQVHHLDPFAQAGGYYMGIIIQVEKHNWIIYWHCCIELWAKLEHNMPRPNNG